MMVMTVIVKSQPIISTQWTETTNFDCEHQLEVCGFNDPNQDNWLITQHINRTLPGGDRLEQVEVTIEYQFVDCISDQCSAFFNVYTYDTSTINPEAAGIVGNFGTMPVNVVTPTDQLGGVKNKTFSLTYSSTDTDSGFYLAIRDQNSCLNISRILVFYNVYSDCPAGQYMYITNTFQCMPCPNNTNMTFVNVEACPCLPTFFRAASDDLGRECTRKWPYCMDRLFVILVNLGLWTLYFYVHLWLGVRCIVAQYRAIIV